MSFYAFFRGWLLPNLPIIPYQATVFALKIINNFIWQSGLFPSRLTTLAPKVCLFFLVYLQLLGFPLPPRVKKITLPVNKKKNISTYIDFAENQLSLSLISLSPLITNHPKILQHLRVQSSSFPSTCSLLDRLASGQKLLTNMFSLRFRLLVIFTC